MCGSLNEILPEPIGPETEEIIREMLKRKMKGAASMFIAAMRAMEERFGPEALQVARGLFGNVTTRPEEELGTPEEDLHTFCDRLDRGCALSHRWERIEDEEDRIAYRFTRCLWAEIYRELDAEDLGRWICEGDDPGVRSYNSKLRCRQTKLLMDGDEECDHVFYVER